MNTFAARTIKPFLIGWCICLVAVGLNGAAFRSKLGPDSTFDFQSFYTAELLARTDPGHLYDLQRQASLQHIFTARNTYLPFYHPSYEPFLFSPLSILSYRSSYFVSIALSMCFVMAAFFSARPAFSVSIPLWQPRPGLMLFIFVPLLCAVELGQDSTLSLLLYCLTWRQLKAEKNTSAGILLALALFKFQIVLPIAVLLAIRTGWRFIVGFLVAALGVALVCIRIVGSAGTVAYFHLLFSAGSAIDKSTVAEARMGLLQPQGMPNLTGLIYAAGGRFLHSPITFDVLIAICSLAIFVWSARIVRYVDLEVAFSIAILCGLLVSYHLFISDLTLALLPVALLAKRINQYFLLGLFGLPIVLVHFGANSLFLLTIPILAIFADIALQSGSAATLPLARSESTAI